MKATIKMDGGKLDGKVIEGKSLQEIQRKLGGYLDVSGPRGLVATVDTGAEIANSLYDGESYIRTTDGKIIR